MTRAEIRNAILRDIVESEGLIEIGITNVHNELLGLQGGEQDNRYHLTQAQAAKVAQIVTNDLQAVTEEQKTAIEEYAELEEPRILSKSEFDFIMDNASTAGLGFEVIQIPPAPYISTSTAGLAFTPIAGGTEQRVAQGTVTTGDVVVAPLHDGLPVTEVQSVGGLGDGFEGVNLTSLIFSENLKSVGFDGFGDATIQLLDLPSTLEELGQSAFENSVVSTLVVRATTPPTLESGAFFNATISQILVPAASVDAYKAAAQWSDFAGVIEGIQETNQQAVSAGTVTTGSVLVAPFRDGLPVTEVRGGGFGDDRPITSLIFSENLKSVGDFGFEGLGSGTAGCFVDLPSTIEELGEEAFFNAAISTLIVRADNPPTLGADVFQNASINKIKVPAASVAAYQAADGWSDFAGIIEEI